MAANKNKIIFSIDNPAQNIQVLLAYLSEYHTNQYIYRGQTKDYGCLVPSLFRNWIIPEKKKNNIFPIDADAFKEHDDLREKIKYRELKRLISYYEVGLGNIFAQQYGITSECIDVTSSPKVAAFFATRKWPTYQHFSGSSESSIGVMYRFPIIDFVSDLNGLNLTMNCAGMKHPNVDTPLWFMNKIFHWQMSSEELTSLISERIWAEKILFSHPAVVSNENLSGYIKQFYEQRNEEEEKFEKSLSDTSSSSQQPILLSMDVEKTRIRRQFGGFLQPSFTYKCLIPNEFNVQYIDILRGYYAKPGTAIIDKTLGVEDLLAYPNLDVFYFRHTDQIIDDFTPSVLWPSKDEDQLLGLIDFVVRLNNSEYLDQNEIETDDMNSGIIDRGYYL